MFDGGWVFDGGGVFFSNPFVLVTVFPRYERMLWVIVIQCVVDVGSIVATSGTWVTLLAVADIHGAVLHAFMPCRE